MAIDPVVLAELTVTLAMMIMAGLADAVFLVPDDVILVLKKRRIPHE